MVSSRSGLVRVVYFVVVALAALCAALGLSSGREAQAQTTTPDFEVLVFSKTAGFRHDSIPNGIAAIQTLGQQNNFQVDATEDATQFNDANLANYEAVIFLSTTGDVLNAEQQAAFERYIANGGGYAGIHSAADTEYDWAWYGEMLGGAYFRSHPANQTATVNVEDTTHPSTSHLSATWSRFDEWYNYRTNPRGDVHVLATLDESSYQPGDGAMGADHPIAWCTNYGGGRSFYTGMGHTQESYSESNFTQHLLGGIRWAAGQATADCGEPREAPPGDTDFQQVTLAKGGDVLGEPMAIAVLPDSRVLSTARDGSVYLTKPDSTTSLAAKVPVYNHDEDGLQGIALDPNFAENNWVYLYYAPPLNTPAGDAPTTADDPSTFDAWKGHNQLSRFKMTGDTIDLSSEQQIMQVPADRGICCHAGGEIDFDAQGNLYLSTGDDSNPFESQGYTPIDEQATRNPAFDAQRSSANTNDLRGKVLRISVQDDGSYTVPAGNLFDEAADADDKTRPEIYAMGFRNPFRFAVDKATGNIMLGEYGPDAGAADPNRGPGGIVEFNLIKGPGNYGWPYCHGDNVPYRDYDFATGVSGPAFNCDAPANESPRNTGLTQLPPIEPAWIDYDNCSVPEFGCGSESPMGGPTYNFDPNLVSDTKFPEYFNGKTFIYEWGRGWIKTVTENADGSPGDIVSFFDSMTLTRPMSVEFGPEGSMYVLDYGGGFFGGDANSALYRIDYVQGNRAPIAETSATPNSGPAPLTVQFSSEGSRELDFGDSIVSYEWDFGDGSATSSEQNPSHIYEQNGTYTARLTVTDTTGKTGTATETITVGNTRPEVTIDTPPNGSFFSFRGQISYSVTVTDPEDEAAGGIDCSRVQVTTSLGHNEHSHQDQSFTGCEGTINVPARWEDQSESIFYIVNASYTDGGGATGAGPLTGTEQVILQPKTLQAEHYTEQVGTQTVAQSQANGGNRVGFIDAGDYIAFEPINLLNMTAVKLRGTSGGSGGNVEFRWNAPDGPVLATVNVANTGGWDNYQDFGPVPLQNVPQGAGTLYLTFTGGFDVDDVTFIGKGVDTNGPPTIDNISATPSIGPAPLDVSFTSSATEPDGEAITYSWDFGDGSPTSTEQNPSHTYAESGFYTATLTVSDPGGRTDTRTVRVSAVTPCGVARSDEFDGTALDQQRWDVIRDAGNYTVENGQLELPIMAGGIYGNTEDATPADAAKNVVVQSAPTGEWTATAKVTAEVSEQFHQAGLRLYSDDSNWASVHLISIGGGSRDLEFIYENNDNARNEAADKISVPADFPSTYYVRLTSDGTNLTASYSTDGVNFTTVGRPAPMSAFATPQIGPTALSGPATTVVPTAYFDYIRVEPDSSGGTTDPNDEFNGSALDKCRWSNIVREDPAGYSVANGALNIDTGLNTDMSNQTTTAENLVLQPMPGGAWEATTKLTLNLKKTYEQAGLMVYGNDPNFIKLSYIKVPDGTNIEFIKQANGSAIDGGAQDRSVNFGATGPSTVYLKLFSDGTDLRAAYSLDGVAWTNVGRARSLGDIPTPYVGMAAYNGDGTNNQASFDYFNLGSEIPFSATASADTTSGRAPLTVNFTGSSSGGDNVTYAWDFQSDGTNDANTQDASYTYTEPGNYTATLTATDDSGETTTDTVDITVDPLAAPCDTPYTPEAGYKMLFDGTEASLENWTQSGGGGFDRDGCVIKSFGNFGLLYYSAEEFQAPYSLKLEWMKPGDDNSGVFVGFPADPDPSDGDNTVNTAITEGEEIQIDSTDDPDSTTGAIYNEQAADAAARDAALNPDGKWNEYEIRVEADRIIVYLNGVKINEWMEDDPNVDLAQGYIGIQNHGVGDDVFFRNIRISEGTANTAPVATDDSARTKANRSVGINVLGNDTDAEGDALSVANASDPAHGTVTLRNDGTILYTPDKNFKGTDTFTYTASDGNAESNTATVTIDVTAGKPTKPPRGG